MPTPLNPYGGFDMASDGLGSLERLLSQCMYSWFLLYISK